MDSFTFSLKKTNGSIYLKGPLSDALLVEKTIENIEAIPEDHAYNVLGNEVLVAKHPEGYIYYVIQNRLFILKGNVLENKDVIIILNDEYTSIIIDGQKFKKDPLIYCSERIADNVMSLYGSLAILNVDIFIPDERLWSGWENAVKLQSMFETKGLGELSYSGKVAYISFLQIAVRNKRVVELLDG